MAGLTHAYIKASSIVVCQPNVPVTPSLRQPWPLKQPFRPFDRVGLSTSKIPYTLRQILHHDTSTPPIISRFEASYMVPFAFGQFYFRAAIFWSSKCVGKNERGETVSERHWTMSFQILRTPTQTLTSAWSFLFDNQRRPLFAKLVAICLFSFCCLQPSQVGPSRSTLSFSVWFNLVVRGCDCCAFVVFAVPKK